MVLIENKLNIKLPYNPVFLLLGVYLILRNSAIKKDELLPFATTGMDLKGIMLSKMHKTEKDKYSMSSLTCGIYI